MSSSGGTKSDYVLKLLTIGDSGVGKSALLLRYYDKTFSSNFIATIGLDFKSKDVVLDGSKVRLNLWDTAGQERFRNIAVAYFRGAQGIMLVFDLTKRATFTAVEGWVKDVEKNTDKKVAKVLVGNKADVADGSGGGKRAVTQAEAAKLAESYGMPYIETSAKSGVNVEDAFEQLAALALANVKREKERGGQGGDRPTTPHSSSKVNLKDGGGGGGSTEKKKSWC